MKISHWQSGFPFYWDALYMIDCPNPSLWHRIEFFIYNIWRCKLNGLSDVDCRCFLFKAFYRYTANNCYHSMFTYFWCIPECNKFVTDGLFHNFNVWRPVKNTWLAVMDCVMTYCEGCHEVYWKINKIWLPWLLVYVRIHEIFNVTEGRDRNVGVDFLLLFCHCYLKGLQHPNTFNHICCHIGFPTRQGECQTKL